MPTLVTNQRLLVASEAEACPCLTNTTVCRDTVCCTPDCGGEEYVSTQGDGCFDVTLFYPAFLIVVIVVLCGLYKVYQRYSNKQQDGQAAVIQVAPWAPTPVAAQPTAMARQPSGIVQLLRIQVSQSL